MMRFISILFCIGFSLLAKAYTIPEGFGDGVYSVHIDDLGEEIHERMGDIPAEANTTNPFTGMEERDIDPAVGHHIYCGCGINLDHGNCDAAVAALKAQLNKNTHVHAAWYSIAGNVVAFICSNNAVLKYYDISASNYALILSQITNACGWYVAGTMQDNQMTGSITYDAADSGYMVYTSGLNFCGRALQGREHGC